MHKGVITGLVVAAMVMAGSAFMAPGFVVSASAQISTEPDESLIQLTPAQAKAIRNPAPEKDKKLEIRAGKSSYIPAPRTADEPITDMKQEPAGSPPATLPGSPALPENTGAPLSATNTSNQAATAQAATPLPTKGREVCDVVANIIARDFRIMVTNPHSPFFDVQTIGSGPYDIAIKSIAPYSGVYSAMGCDGKALQTTIAGVLRQAALEGKKKK